MARSDLITKLMQAAISNDKTKAIRIGEAIIAEEREKKHHIFADRLACIIRDNGSSSNRSGRILGNGLSSLIYEITPERPLSSLFLNKDNLGLLKEVVEEHQRKDLLDSYGLAPRNRLMFIGAPGNGKTSLAEALAHELMLPMIVIRYEGLIGSYLGETASRLNRVFEYVRQRHCLLFFDEFDSIGKERGDQHETGEIKRVVSSLLLQIDGLLSRNVIVVASNHPHLLDFAAWRRFQVRIELCPPSTTDIKKYLDDYQRKTDLNFGIPTETIANKVKASSYAELEEFCRDVLRCSVLDKMKQNARAITYKKLNQWESRYQVKLANHTVKCLKDHC